MLKNHQFELPNVRLAITERQDGNKLANIIAIQSSQLTRSNKDVSDIIKQSTPKTSTFRYYNPDHFVSLVLAMGILNGLGIKEIEVQDFMPIRFRKTVKDNGMNEQEAEGYIKRVYDKNIACYFKMVLTCDGIEITNYPGGGANLHLTTDDVVHFNNPFLENLYSIGYNYANTLNISTLSK